VPWIDIVLALLMAGAALSLENQDAVAGFTIAHNVTGEFDLERLQKMAADWPGLEGMDLAKEVSRLQVERWTGGKWVWGEGYEMGGDDDARPHVVAVDYGSKRNIFRNLVEAGAKVTILPATASFEEAMSHEPDGFFLSNGPGDPAATGEYAIPVIRQMLDSEKPLFGICLGHQLLALAVGGKTAKMFQGHRGANHPVKRLEDGRVEITAMNHGFAVERDGLPNNVVETHVSLFDGSNCGIELTDKPAFSVQYHPEAAPGPHDAAGLFLEFRQLIEQGAVDVVQPNAAITGGITDWLRIHALATLSSVPVSPWNLQMVHIHLAAGLANVMWIEYFMPDNPLLEFQGRLFRGPVLREEATPEGIFLAPPDAPGLGLELDDAVADASWVRE